MRNDTATSRLNYGDELLNNADAAEGDTVMGTHMLVLFETQQGAVQ